MIKKAFILAAGLGSRMYPLTEITAKPLVRVNGVRIIDTIIRALHEKQIFDITIVTGHLNDLFRDLNKEFDNLKFIYNKDYSNSNNISSVYSLGDNLSNSIIIEGDILIKHNILRNNYNGESGYYTISKVDTTNEWSFDIDSNGYIVDCNKKEGKYPNQMYGISFWNYEDGRRLFKYIKNEYENGNKNIFWDEIALFKYKEVFKLKTHVIPSNSIIEIDSIEELSEIDNDYIKYVGDKL